MANNKRDEAASSDIQAVDRVGQICALFGPGSAELTAADIAELTGLNRTTAYRYCSSMVACGLLDRGTRRGTFVLGGLMLQMGILALGRQRVLDIAADALRDLRDRVRMTTVLSIWGASGPVVALVEEDVSRTMTVTVPLGTRLDHAAAQMAVFYAYAEDARRAAAERLWNAQQKRTLRASVASVREKGYQLVKRTDGLFAVAAPIFDDRGICATVAILGVRQMADLSESAPLFEELRATAAQISTALGG